MDDDELIAAVAGGDDAALRELFSRHAPWLAARLRAVLPAAEVEDALQETFLAVWQGARGYRPAARPGDGCGESRGGRPRCCCAAAGPPPRGCLPCLRRSGRKRAIRRKPPWPGPSWPRRSPPWARPAGWSARSGGCATSRTGRSPRWRG